MTVHGAYFRQFRFSVILCDELLFEKYVLLVETGYYYKPSNLFKNDPLTAA